MNIFSKRTWSAVALGFALSCIVSGTAWAQDPAIVAKVGDQNISIETFRTYIAGRIRTPYEQLTDDQKNQFLTELVDLFAVASDARNKGLDKNTDVQTKIEIQNNTILAEAVVQDVLGNQRITEAELQSAYDQHVEGLAQNEYKARHILHKTEAEAAQTIADLNGGADFVTLAQERSTGPTGKNGGDLGWFSPSQMVQPFANAVITAEPGRVVPSPVQTQFGWHVILVEERREAAPPSFDELRDSLAAEMQAKMLDDYVSELRNSMKIEKFF